MEDWENKGNKNGPRFLLEFRRCIYVPSSRRNLLIIAGLIFFLLFWKMYLDAMVDDREALWKLKQQELTRMEATLQEKEKIYNDIIKTAGDCFRDSDKQSAVKNAFLHAWTAYSKHAWGHDELKPITLEVHNWMHMGLSIVDSLDTLYIMGLTEEFERAKQWVATSLNFDKDATISVFETTIRVLGGLEAAYELSGDKLFLDKAVQLADKLILSFNTPSGIPKTSINLANGYTSNPGWTGGASILSEIGTVQMEYNYLSYHTKDPKYAETALKVYDVLDKMQKPKDDLYPVYVHPDSKSFSRNHVTLGALGDSFYEYLLKLWVLRGKTTDANSEQYKRMYRQTTKSIVDHLLMYSEPNKLTWLSELNGESRITKMDHLVCFAGGMFALGSVQQELFSVEEEHIRKLHMDIGKNLTKTCYEMYHRMKTGIAPELIHFGNGQNAPDFYVAPNDRHYLLRPETAESFFVLWRVTKDPIYRQWGWEIFTAINTYCRVDNGFSGIRNVDIVPVEHDNLQQSFFLAETLKYLYLLFSENSLIPLDKYVFNTEAHPLGIFQH